LAETKFRRGTFIVKVLTPVSVDNFSLEVTGAHGKPAVALVQRFMVIHNDLASDWK
jgi:hypothetical protein